MGARNRACELGSRGACDVAQGLRTIPPYRGARNRYGGRFGHAVARCGEPALVGGGFEQDWDQPATASATLRIAAGLRTRFSGRGQGGGTGGPGAGGGGRRE